CCLLFVTIAAAVLDADERGPVRRRCLHASRPVRDGRRENGAELFYYFIESEGDPSTDPVLLWLTGGDRCSVLSALFFEIGPLKLVIEPYNGSLPRLHYHPYSWTKVASILFVDSPVGAGFSFSRDPKGYDVGDVSASLQLSGSVAILSTSRIRSTSGETLMPERSSHLSRRRSQKILKRG
ncbi:hypothetical protein EE612_055164, partial [Oryza sativa]